MRKPRGPNEAFTVGENLKVTCTLLDPAMRFEMSIELRKAAGRVAESVDIEMIFDAEETIVGFDL